MYLHPQRWTEPGVQAYQFNCNPISQPKQFEVIVVAGPSEAPTLRIRSFYSGKCLTVPGGTQNNGAPVAQYTCSGNGSSGSPFLAEQLWVWDSANQLVNLETGKCLSVANKWQSAQVKLIQWSCSGDAAQRWSLI